MHDLNARLLAAHAAGDTAALVTLYRAAAHHTQDANAAGFFLTQAYVYALEIGHPAAADLRADLVSRGRETPL